MSKLKFAAKTREEEVQIIMKLNKEAFDKHEKAVRALCPDLETDLKDGDDLRVDYKFFIQYFGSVEEKLKVVGELCSDSAVIIEADCAMLEEGKILCYRILKQLDNVIRIIKHSRSKQCNSCGSKFENYIPVWATTCPKCGGTLVVNNEEKSEGEDYTLPLNGDDNDS